MGKKIILLLMMVSSFCLISLTSITICAENVSLNIHQLSSIENFILRKAYPYEDKSSIHKLFSAEMTTPNINQYLSSSSCDSNPNGLNGPMNSSWPMKSYNAQRIGRTPSSTAENPGIEKWRFETYISGVDSGAVVDNNNTVYFGSKDYRLYALYPNGTLKWFYETALCVIILTSGK